MKPILTRSEITGAVYIVPKYKILEGGVIDAIEKCDVTDQFDAMTESLRAENAKLRELCADMWRDIPKTESCGWDMSTNTCTGSDECIGECSYWYRMRDLGIEVE